MKDICNNQTIKHNVFFNKKKNILLLIVALIPLYLHAEKKFNVVSSIYSSALDTTLNILSNGSVFIYEGISDDEYATRIRLSNETTQYCYLSAKKIRKKYLKWEKIATNNDVTDFNKEIGVDMEVYVEVFQDNEWNEGKKQHKMNSYFNVTSDGKKQIILRAEGLLHSCSIILSGEEEVDQLVEAFNIKQLRAKAKSTEKKFR